MKQITELTDTIKFGKHKGLTIEQILIDDPTYIHWIIHNNILLFSNNVIKELIELETYDNELSWGDMNDDWGDRD